MTPNPAAFTTPLLAVSIAIALSGCNLLHRAGPADHTAEHPTLAITIPPGAREVLNTHLDPKPDHDLIVTDAVLAPNAQIPAHYHPADELTYIIEGSVIHIEQGKPNRIVQAGEMLVIPAGAIHAPKAGSGGARGIIIRINKTGEPDTIAVPDSGLMTSK